MWTWRVGFFVLFCFCLFFFNWLVRKDFTKKLALKEGLEESEGTSFVKIRGCWTDVLDTQKKK